MQVTKYDAARRWLKLGFDLLPIQPGTKRIVQGFGQYQKKISTLEDVSRWWDLNAAKDLHSANLAVVANGDNFILDFDVFEVYAEWAKACDEIYSTSYTEFTPHNGAHVFLCGNVPKGLQLREGVELKRVVLVAPSVVDGSNYQAGFGGIYSGDVDAVFSSLTIPGTPTAHLLRTRKCQDHAAARPGPQLAVDVIGQIKARFQILDVLERYAPDCYNSLRGSGRWRGAVCPFHKGGREKSASFWIDTERNVFGCHTCNTRGDVINLYALLKGVRDKDAIRDLCMLDQPGGKNG